jgi:hypothetical protein
MDAKYTEHLLEKCKRVPSLSESQPEVVILRSDERWIHGETCHLLEQGSLSDDGGSGEAVALE